MPDALRAVRPTVFFSVPRLYEKRSGHGSRNARSGRRFLAMPDGAAKRALGAILGRAVLRRAGLDRCAQLIVGSAPVPEGLLRAFRELGIEMHNAYGLTEAPLVTHESAGRNRIGTVGEPLPGTERAHRGGRRGAGARTAGDGRLRGRRTSTQPFRDGWLATGDLGTDRRRQPGDRGPQEGAAEDLVRQVRQPGQDRGAAAARSPA